MARSRLGLTDELSGNAQADKLGPCTKRLLSFFCLVTSSLFIRKTNRFLPQKKRRKTKQNEQLRNSRALNGMAGSSHSKPGYLGLIAHIGFDG